MDVFNSPVPEWIQAVAAILALIVPIVIFCKENKKDAEQADEKQKNRINVAGDGNNIYSVQQNNLDQRTYQINYNQTNNTTNNYYDKVHSNKYSSNPATTGDEVFGWGVAIVFIFGMSIYVQKYFFFFQGVSFVLTGLILILLALFPDRVLTFKKNRSLVASTFYLIIFFLQPVLVGLVTRVPQLFVDFSDAQALFINDMGIANIISVIMAEIINGNKEIVLFAIYCFLVILSYGVLIATNLCVLIQAIFANKPQGGIIKLIHKGYELRYGSLYLGLSYAILFSVYHITMDILQ